MSQPMIHIDNVSKSYDGGKTFALQNFSLTIERGDFVALLGPSGCGKSTTLMLLCGLYRPTSGNIYFEGRLVNNVEPKSRNIGMVFQSYALYPNLSVYENIAFPLRQMKNVGKGEIDKRVQEVAQMVKIDPLLKRMPGQLSGGQQQRVAMCRALVKKPDILLLDEPMSNLDARLKLEIRDEIKKLQATLNLTTVIVTHDQEEAMAISSKIAVIDNGLVQQYAVPDSLYGSPKNLFVASFIGTPPVNFIAGEIEEQADCALFCANCGQLRLPKERVQWAQLRSKAVVLAVRPHHFRLVDPDENALRFSVEYVEHLGKEHLLKCYAGETSARVLVPVSPTDYQGRLLHVVPDIDRINVFDKETGNNITVSAD